MTPARIRELEEADAGFDAGSLEADGEMGWAGALLSRNNMAAPRLARLSLR